MALSNIFREPRREITESLVGIAFACGVLYGDYHFGAWVNAGSKNQIPTGVGMIFGLLAVVIVMFLLFFTHFIGEVICEALADRGLEVRPRDRR